MWNKEGRGGNKERRGLREARTGYAGASAAEACLVHTNDSSMPKLTYYHVY